VVTAADRASWSTWGEARTNVKMVNDQCPDVKEAGFDRDNAADNLKAKSMHL
jgi:hypothetical protein